MLSAGGVGVLLGVATKNAKKHTNKLSLFGFVWGKRPASRQAFGVLDFGANLIGKNLIGVSLERVFYLCVSVGVSVHQACFYLVPLCWEESGSV